MFQGYGIEEFAQEAYVSADKRAPVVDGYDYKPELSTGDVAVYENPETKKAVVGFRGTSKVRDINPDIGIAGNRFKSTDRYKSDKAQLNNVIQKYGKDNVRLTGHSLGGKSASTLAQDYGIKADTFNEGSTPLQMKGNFWRNPSCKFFPSQQKCKNAKLVTKHLIPGDPISAWNLFSSSNVKYYKPKSANLHSLSNFEGLDI